MNNKGITDWDNAYANAAHIPGGDQWPDAWVEPAQKFREACQFQPDIAYGQHPRQIYDLFIPENKPIGLFVFLHCGYWLALDKSYWSHLASGAIDTGWAVAIPSYVLCPEVGIDAIVTMIGSAVENAATRISGPIAIAGHSAGGHLTASMITETSPLTPVTRSRITRAVSISGLHDLRPLRNTSMNEQFNLSESEATRLSPSMQQPLHNCHFTAWVGRDERPEFIRQSKLLVQPWQGSCASVECVVQPGRHHFTIIDDLADVNSHLMKTVLGQTG